MDKLCKQCFTSNEKVKFHGKFCRPCVHRNKLEKPYKELNLPIPPKHGSQIRCCKQCNLVDNKKVFHGRICKKCFRKNNWSTPVLRIRSDVSRTIRLYLKKNGYSKNNNSILQFLDYSIDELKAYIESLFEPWMNWDNQGLYIKSKWDDNNQATWRWQIDHIIPQSNFPYSSMEDENFKICWALKNLRPIKAKDNLLKGNR